MGAVRLEEHTGFGWGNALGIAAFLLCFCDVYIWKGGAADVNFFELSGTFFVGKRGRVAFWACGIKFNCWEPIVCLCIIQTHIL